MAFPLNAANLIPQKVPIVLVDRLLKSDEEKSVSDFEIREDCIFVKDGVLVLAGLMENIAQTCALRTGYNAMNRGGRVRVGVIGGVKQFTVSRFPAVGERLTTTVKEVLNMDPAMLFSAEILVGGETVASGEMKVFLNDEEA